MKLLRGMDARYVSQVTMTMKKNVWKTRTLAVQDEKNKFI